MSSPGSSFGSSQHSTTFSSPKTLSHDVGTKTITSTSKTSRTESHVAANNTLDITAKEQDVGNGEERIAEDLRGVGFWVAWRER
jgi:hypothetical protein